MESQSLLTLGFRKIRLLTYKCHTNFSFPLLLTRWIKTHSMGQVSKYFSVNLTFRLIVALYQVTPRCYFRQTMKWGLLQIFVSLQSDRHPARGDRRMFPDRSLNGECKIISNLVFPATQEGAVQPFKEKPELNQTCTVQM